MSKSDISVNTRPVADRYGNEKIIEFSSPVGGGLISFTITPDDQLSVHVYRQDMTVSVTAGPPCSPPACPLRQHAPGRGAVPGGQGVRHRLGEPGMTGNFTPNKLIECPEPGILFTRDNAMWAYCALQAVRDGGQSIPEQDELCDELAALLFPPQNPPADRPFEPGELVIHVSHRVGPGGNSEQWVPGVFRSYPNGVGGPLTMVTSLRDALRGVTNAYHLVKAAEVRRIRPEQISAARSWVADCDWADIGGDVADLTDLQIVAGVQRFYAGGWAAFIRDGGEDDPRRDDPVANYQDGPCGDH